MTQRTSEKQNGGWGVPSSFGLGLTQAENAGRMKGVIREKLVRLVPGSRDSVRGKLFRKNFTQVSGDGTN